MSSEIEKQIVLEIGKGSQPIFGACKDKSVAPESENNLRLEIGHVLCIDLVGSLDLEFAARHLVYLRGN